VTLLTVTDLQLSINNNVILKDIDLTLNSGEVLGIVGESGSGKSMTAYSIMRLLPNGAKLQGSIVLNGIELTSLSEARMCDIRGKDVGMIFQEPMTALNPVMSIGDQIDEVFRFHVNMKRKQRRERSMALLSDVHLPDPPHRINCLFF